MSLTVQLTSPDQSSVEARVVIVLRLGNVR